MRGPQLTDGVPKERCSSCQCIWMDRVQSYGCLADEACLRYASVSAGRSACTDGFPHLPGVYERARACRSNFCGSIRAHAATDRLRLTELLFNSVTNSGETTLAALIVIAPCPYWSLNLLA